MRNPGGYFISTDPDPTKSKGQVAVTERDTITCGHRGELVMVPPLCKPEDMPFEICWGCRRYICRKCAAEMNRTMKCEVIETRIERLEARERFRREL